MLSSLFLFRAVVLNYLKNYELKEKMNQVMDFLVAQLDYEVEVGRLAATDILTLAFREVGKKVYKIKRSYPITNILSINNSLL